jgi:hypothetical protein
MLDGMTLNLTSPMRVPAALSHRYQLSSHTHACAVDDCVVLLDLKSNKYLALPLRETLPLESLVYGWPQIRSESGSKIISRQSNTHDLVTALENRGVLTSNTVADFREFIRPEPANKELIEQDLPVSLNAIDTARFISSCASVAIRIKIQRFDKIVDRARRRKSHGSDTKFDIDLVRAQVHKFNRLRPFLYKQQKACLFDSLALLEFLASSRIYPMWIIGVQMHPFKAHTWLQQGSYLLNDVADNIGGFTPIMAV